MRNAPYIKKEGLMALAFDLLSKVTAAFFNRSPDYKA